MFPKGAVVFGLFFIFSSTLSSDDNRRILRVQRFPDGVAVVGDSDESDAFDLVACGHKFLDRLDIAFFGYDFAERKCFAYRNVTGVRKDQSGAQTFFISRDGKSWRDHVQCLEGWTMFEERCYRMLPIDFDASTSPEEMTDKIFHDCSRHSGVAAAQAVSIHSAKQNHFLAELTYTDDTLYTAGIGLIAPFDRTTFGAETFRWTDGTAMDFTVWDVEHAQPDNHDGLNEYLTMIFYDGMWHDYDVFDNNRLWCYYNVTLTI